MAQIGTDIKEGEIVPVEKPDPTFVPIEPAAPPVKTPEPVEV